MRLRTLLNDWRSLRRRSVNSRILASTLAVGGFTTLTKLVGGVKVMAIARFFGTNDALEAFLVAFLLPMFLAEVIGGAFNSALIPVLMDVREQQGRAAEQRLFRAVTGQGLALLTAVAILLAAAASIVLPVIASGFSAEKLALTRLLLLALLPVLVLSGLNVMWRAVLNADERFALAAAAPAATPILTICMLFVLGATRDARALVAGAVLGTVLEVVIVACGLVRQGYRLMPSWSVRYPAMDQVWRQYLPMLGGSLVLSGMVLVDQAMAAMLGPGSVAALNYGNKLFLLIAAIGPVSLGTVALPHFSRMAAVREWPAMVHTLKTYTRLILVLTVPLTLVLVLLSEPLVRLVLQGGAFSGSDTGLVASVQRYYLLQLPFTVLGVLVLRLASSLKANQVIFRAAVLGLVIKIGLNYVFMMRMGVAGIGLATSIVSFVSLCYISYHLIRLLSGITKERALVAVSDALP